MICADLFHQYLRAFPSSIRQNFLSERNADEDVSKSILFFVLVSFAADASVLKIDMVEDLCDALRRPQFGLTSFNKNFNRSRRIFSVKELTTCQRRFHWLKLLDERERERNDGLDQRDWCPEERDTGRERERKRNSTGVVIFLTTNEQRKLLDEPTNTTARCFALLRLFLIIGRDLYLFKQEKTLFSVRRRSKKTERNRIRERN